MSIETVNKLLKQKENIRLEFKEAKTALPSNLFETICAMLNRDGGDILLGVEDNGEVVGVGVEQLDTMMNNVVNMSNNPQKIDPPFILFPMKLQIKDKVILHIQIPSSSQVHKTAGVIFDRSSDGDFKLSNPAQIADLYNKKRIHFSENTIFPYLKSENFKSELFPKIRNLIRSNNPDHPWLALSNEEMLEKAGLWKVDFQTGQTGYTLAAALLFGKDEVIQQILPHYKIDALVRVRDEYRFDDRVYIQTNLIEAYEQLMDFVAKHLPDKFFQKGDQRMSLRTHIFREIVANLIVHREYTNAHPCTFVIKKGKVETENANNPHGTGLIDLHHFVPFPKNPTLAKFFIQLGRVDELGSGVINVNRYISEYSDNGKPTFSEGNPFKMEIPIPEEEEEGVIDFGAVNSDFGAVNSDFGAVNGDFGAVNGDFGAVDKFYKLIDIGTENTKEKLSIIIKIIFQNEGKRIPEYSSLIDMPKRTVQRLFQQLKEADLIEFKGDSPKTGGYYITEYLKDKLK